MTTVLFSAQRVSTQSLSPEFPRGKWFPFLWAIYELHLIQT